MTDRSQWVVKTESEEISLSSLDEVRARYVRGEVRPENYVWHPVLEKWMYASEMKELSSAAAVPSTAAPSAKRKGVHPVVTFGCLGTVLLIVGLGVIDPDNPGLQSSASQQVATLDKSESMQKQRKELIQKLIREGAFQKVEMPGSLPRVWVRPAFYALDFETKEKFIGVVYAYYFDGTNETDSVRIFDSQSGKEVGDYSPLNPGLKMR